jgi:hypothetical protein
MATSINLSSQIDNLSLHPVEQDVISRASFEPTNTFAPGELVITPSLRGTSYFYSCVTSSYLTQVGSRQLLMFWTVRHFPSRNCTVGFTPGTIGKILPSSLAKVSLFWLKELIQQSVIEPAPVIEPLPVPETSHLLNPIQQDP